MFGFVSWLDCSTDRACSVILFSFQDQLFYNKGSKQCLTARHENPSLVPCNPADKYQLWVFTWTAGAMTHTHTHTRTHRCTHAHTHTHTHTHTLTHTHRRTHARTHAHTDMHARTHTHSLSLRVQNVTSCHSCQGIQKNVPKLFLTGHENAVYSMLFIKIFLYSYGN